MVITSKEDPSIPLILLSLFLSLMLARSLSSACFNTRGGYSSAGWVFEGQRLCTGVGAQGADGKNCRHSCGPLPQHPRDNASNKLKSTRGTRWCSSHPSNRFVIPPRHSPRRQPLRSATELLDIPPKELSRSTPQGIRTGLLLGCTCTSATAVCHPRKQAR